MEFANKQESMKILIIQQKMIGDVLTCSILFEILRKEFPHAQLDYLINTHTYPVVKNNPFVDNFILFEAKQGTSFKTLRAFGKRIEEAKYDVIIDSYSKISSNIFSYYSKAETRITFQKWYSNFLYTNTSARQYKATTIAGLAIENRLSLLEPILKKPATPLPPKIYLTVEEKEKAKSYLIENGIDLSRPIYMISILGSGPLKTYPKDYMAQLLDWLAQALPNGQILFNYLPKQLAEVQATYSLCQKNTQDKVRLNIYGESLRDFMAITSFCDAVIGNEGGAINIGKALSRKTFSVFSPWIEQENWTVFEDGINTTSVHLKDFHPELYTGILEKKLKKQSLELYKKLKPALFEEKYKNFLEHLNTIK